MILYKIASMEGLGLSDINEGERAEFPPIASFWMGGQLSFLEHLCLKSFVDLGHPVFLYSYEEITNLPKGVVLEDARQILPEEEYFEFVGHPNPAPAVFSDKFRIYLLLRRDIIWVDCDVYALKPYENKRYILAREFETQLSNAVLRLPQNSPCLFAYAKFMYTHYPEFPEDWYFKDYIAEEVKKVREGEPRHILSLKYYHWGPLALTYFTQLTGEDIFSMPPRYFFPIPGYSAQQVLRRFRRMPNKPSPDAWSIHFYSSKLKPKLRRRLEGDNLPQASYLFKLCQRHDIDPMEYPI